jgi:hypothetical protein
MSLAAAFWPPGLCPNGSFYDIRLLSASVVSCLYAGAYIAEVQHPRAAGFKRLHLAFRGSALPN